MLTPEAPDNHHLDLTDPNKFVEPGMIISNAAHANSKKNGYSKYHEDINYNYSGLKRDLMSTQFGNLVVYSQRPVEPNPKKTGAVFEV